MSDSISSEILDILVKHAGSGGDKITLETPLQFIGIDSLKMVEIIFDLEERFDISIPDPDYVGGQGVQIFIKKHSLI